MTNSAYQEGMEYLLAHCRRFLRASRMAESGIHSFADVEAITRAICGSAHGYSSFFDLRQRSMRLYRRLHYRTPFDFVLPR